jgi:hypothetical protein
MWSYNLIMLSTGPLQLTLGRETKSSVTSCADHKPAKRTINVDAVPQIRMMLHRNNLNSPFLLEALRFDKLFLLAFIDQ